jgi:hypothetical protein
MRVSNATDEQNLAKLSARSAAADRRAAYVWRSLRRPGRGEEVFEGTLQGRLDRRPARTERVRLRPRVRSRRARAGRRAHDGRASARGQGRDQPSRAAARAFLDWIVGGRCDAAGSHPSPGDAFQPPRGDRARRGRGPTKFGAARLSVVSNSILIVLKIAAGAITGSVAIVTEAVHSSIDLLASVVAYVSLRKADEPADERHMYGHAKIENVAAAIEAC